MANSSNPLKPAAETPKPPVTPPAPKPFQATHISVTIEIVTTDHLQKIAFTLTKSAEKSKDGLTSSDSWKVTFELQGRASVKDQFERVVKLDVDVAHEHNDIAAETHKNGFDQNQHDQIVATGVIAQAVPDGDATDEDVKAEAAKVIPARAASKTRAGKTAKADV